MKQLSGLLIALWALPTPARAYFDACPTLGGVVNASTNIVVLQVEKVSKEKRVIIFKKVADLKGRHNTEQVKYHLTDGLHLGEPKVILDWAEPGQVAIAFHNGKVCLACLGRYWFESSLGEDSWWTMSRARTDLSLAFFGSTSRLRQHVGTVLADKEVVVTALSYNGMLREAVLFKNALRGKQFPICRIRVSLKMPANLVSAAQDPRFRAGEGAGDSEAVPALVEALKHEEGRVRAEAAEELGLIGRPARAAVPALFRALKDTDGLVRLRAAGALAQLDPKHPAALPALLQGMQEKEAKMRKAAAESLGDIGPEAKAAETALVEALRDADLGVRWAAAEALGLVGPEAHAAVPALAKALKDREILAAVAAALGQIGPAAKDAVPALSEVLKEKDRALRWVAAVALVRIDPSAAGPASRLFAEALNNPDERARYDVMIYLSRMGSAAKEAAPDLAALLRHRDPAIRANAVRGLASIGFQASAVLPALVEALQDENQHIRYLAALTLGDAGPKAKAALPALAARLNDGECWPRITAARAVWRIGGDTKAAVPILIAAARGVGVAREVFGPYPRIYAIVELGEMGAQARGAIPALTTALKDQVEDVRKAAAAALKKIDPDAAGREQ